MKYENLFGEFYGDRYEGIKDNYFANDLYSLKIDYSIYNTVGITEKKYVDHYLRKPKKRDVPSSAPSKEDLAEAEEPQVIKQPRVERIEPEKIVGKEAIPTEITEMQRYLSQMRKSLSGMISEIIGCTGADYNERMGRLTDRIDKLRELVSAQINMYVIPPSSELGKKRDIKVTLDKNTLAEYDQIRQEWSKLMGNGLVTLRDSYKTAGSIPIGLVLRKEVPRIIAQIQEYSVLFETTAGPTGTRIRDLIKKTRAMAMEFTLFDADMFLRNILDPLEGALREGKDKVAIGGDNELSDEEKRSGLELIKYFRELTELGESQLEKEKASLMKDANNNHTVS